MDNNIFVSLLVRKCMINIHVASEAYEKLFYINVGADSYVLNIMCLSFAYKSSLIYTCIYSFKVQKKCCSMVID